MMNLKVDTSILRVYGLFAALVVMPFMFVPGASAQEPCSCETVGIDVSETPSGQRLSIHYTVVGAPGVDECVIKLEVTRRGQTANDTGKTLVVKIQGVALDGQVKRIDVDIPRVSVVEIATNLTGTPRPPPPAIELGAAGFLAAEPRRSISSLGEEQALGLAFRVDVPVRRTITLGAEFELPTRRALDSELSTTFSERRYLRDVIVVGIVGREVSIGSGHAVLEAVVPKIGLGIARLNTERIRYTVVNNVVRSATDKLSATSPVFTGGIDARFHLWQSAHLVLGYRLHALFKSSDEVLRSRWLQRPEIGVQWLVGEKQ